MQVLCHEVVQVEDKHVFVKGYDVRPYPKALLKFEETLKLAVFCVKVNRIL